MRHTFIHEDLKKLMSTFRYDSHPMGLFITTHIICYISSFSFCIVAPGMNDLANAITDDLTAVATILTNLADEKILRIIKGLVQLMGEWLENEFVT